MIETKLHGEIWEIVIDNPPVNLLDADIRQGIADAVDRGEADPRIAAIVIRGGGKAFSAGADIVDFGRLFAEPYLPTMLDRIAACTTPVIAAIHGLCFGGGCELALAAHYRLAAPSARIGLPEVKIGLMPGAGGTQRLPRLIGAEAALKMILSGDPVSATEAEAWGLVDRLVDEKDFAAEAISFARTRSRARRGEGRVIDADAELFERFAAMSAITGLDAPQACIAAVRAATLLPLSEGLERERALFAVLKDGEQSRAMRHIFFAERAAAKIEGLPRDAPTRPIRAVGIAGTGAAADAIAAAFLSAGLAVIGAGDDEAADFGALGSCDLIVDAVGGDAATRKAVFARLGGVAKAGAILAAAGDYPDIGTLAVAARRPAEVTGLHVLDKVLEVARGAATAPDVLATMMEIGRRMGKLPVLTRSHTGSIVNRLCDRRRDDVERLLRDGVAAEQIERVLAGFGIGAGAMAISCPVGGGPAAAGAVDEQEILTRTLYAAINEAASIVEQGIVQRASDIDVIHVHALGWPRWRGGPMCWADMIGLERVVAGLEHYRDRLGPDFRLSVLLKRKADARETFL